MIRMLISLPIIAVILVFAFVNNELVTFNLWPFDIEVTSSFSVVVISLILIGYVLGRLSGWIAYLPLRKDLVMYKMQNKKLCKVHKKVCDDFANLKGDFDKKSKETLTDVTIIEEFQPQKENKSGFKETLVKLFKSPEK